MFVNALLGLIICSAVASATIGNKNFRPMGQSVPRHSFVQTESSSADATHELIFAVKQRNLDQMDRQLMERSTPGSPLYQQWLSFEEVGQLTGNPDGAKAVEDWLAENGIQVAWKSAHSDYIKATAKISKWEEMLDTKFFVFEDQSRALSTKKSHRMMHRATTYSLPEHVSPHLSTVFNTVQVPPVFHQKYYHHTSFKTEVSARLRKGRTLASGYPEVTVSFLNDLYGMGGLEGNVSMSQSVFETGGESFSPNDLQEFQEYYKLRVQEASAPYGFTSDECNLTDDDGATDCMEGNLDVQYIMGVAPGIATIYW